MYSIKTITNSEDWDAFIQRQTYSPFVQSPRYGMFYESFGETARIIGVYRGEELVGGSLVLTTHAKRGNFLYLPYGPILDYTDSDMVRAFVSELLHVARSLGMDFVRISPFLEDTEQGRGALQRNGFRDAPMHVLAENTWILDVTQSKEQLLAGMKKNHRNLLRRCEREGVMVTEHKEKDSLEMLHELLDITEKRHHFTRFSRSYIDAEFAAFSEHDEVSMFVATLPDGAVDAAAVVMWYGNMAVYRHSGSKNLDKRLPTSYLIQWHIIQEAKRRGCHWYNFWGVEPVGSGKRHPFAGIGHFKRGFGGFQLDLLHCQDIPVTQKYWLNWVVETFRKWKRGF